MSAENSVHFYLLLNRVYFALSLILFLLLIRDANEKRLNAPPPSQTEGPSYFN